MTELEVSTEESARVDSVDAADAWRSNEILQMYKSNLVFIDFDERNFIHRIDLRDFRSDKVLVPDFLSNITIPRGQNMVFALSKVKNKLYRIFIDVSLMTLMDVTDIPDCASKPEIIRLQHVSPDIR